MKRLAASSLPLFLTISTLLAQSPSATEDAAASPSASLTGAQAAGVLAGFGLVACLPFIIGVVLWLWIAIWVTKDANRRNSPNATLVKVLAWIPATTFIGWIVHLATRPKTISNP